MANSFGGVEVCMWRCKSVHVGGNMDAEYNERMSMSSVDVKVSKNFSLLFPNKI